MLLTCRRIIHEIADFPTTDLTPIPRQVVRGREDSALSRLGEDDSFAMISADSVPCVAWNNQDPSVKRAERH